ncbi:bifunctional riboflavin kinase/FAD synthetase [Deminuibacter soli]|uniref:Riboflavin biosynthesis protein n=1 Tax=Deminuibacter soli TaxID=2291815 RepID=A0A3E1NLZ7_9BACT|nr:bifunctional riboflavin kinase/FAD synthetase [Deminuibacter soli]RFM28864.1 bifunctional riboflavin kinase/FAD synthetase [Deminuibacter soli]
MQVHRDINSLPAFKNAVVTIGTFDGVHTGHQQIIAQLRNEAAAIGGETVIITFHPHPRHIIPGKTPPQLLTTLEEKLFLLARHGVDHVVVVPFSTEFSNQPAASYVQHFLFEKFHPHTVIIGYDHRFGKDRQGDYHLLEDFGAQLGFAVKEIPEQILHEVIISSTRIRQAIQDNDVATANEFLGHPYFFEGTVVEGNRLGRTIGFPTANLHIENAEKLVPGNGVYAVTAELVAGQQYETESNTLKGMMNIGVRPTVNGVNRTIEVNLFDFSEDIYGKMLRVYVHHHLRNEQKFNGLDALKAQLAQDALNAKVLL